MHTVPVDQSQPGDQHDPSVVADALRGLAAVLSLEVTAGGMPDLDVHVTISVRGDDQAEDVRTSLVDRLGAVLLGQPGDPLVGGWYGVAGRRGPLLLGVDTAVATDQQREVLALRAELARLRERGPGPDPVAYLVAERRDGRWVIGDDWNRRCDTLDEARTVAQEWRSGAYADDVAVLAVAVVPDPVAS